MRGGPLLAATLKFTTAVPLPFALDVNVIQSASVEAATPLGRWGGEAEIVKAVAFLIASDFVTGETIRVDGGRHIR